jgi:hypothetical protein
MLEAMCLHIPPLCKGRLGGVEIQLCAHVVAPAALAACWHLAFLPPLAIAWCVPQGATFTYKGGGFPHRSVLLEQPTRFPEDPTNRMLNNKRDKIRSLVGEHST